MRSPGISLILVAGISVSASATSYREDAQSSVAATPTSDRTIDGWVRDIQVVRIGERITSKITFELEAPGPQEPPTLTFLAPGGSIDGVAMRIAGAPQFSIDEHARVTVRQTSSGLRLAGLANGKVVLP